MRQEVREGAMFVINAIELYFLLYGVNFLPESLKFFGERGDLPQAFWAVFALSFIHLACEGMAQITEYYEANRRLFPDC